MSVSTFAKNLIKAVEAVDQVVNDVKQARPIISKVLNKIKGAGGNDKDKS